MMSVDIYKKSFIAAIVWIASVAAIFVHISTYGIVEPYVSKLIYGYSCLISLSYCAFQVIKGIHDPLHRGFIVLNILSLSLFFVFIILQFQFGIEDYKVKISTFLIAEIITLGCVIKSGLKRGLFKNEQSML